MNQYGNHRFSSRFFGTIFLATMMASATAAMSQSAPDPGLDKLTNAAKAEGELTFYTAATENVAKRVTEAFQTKYGIKTRFLRLGSGALSQRFMTEAQAGTFAADLVLIAGGAAALLQEGIQKGWVEPIQDANLPVLASGQFPARLVKNGGAIILIAPWAIVYNTDLVKGADVPKTWQDILNPKFKGKLLIPDTKAADSYLDVWALLYDTYGESFFAGLRAQNPRWYDDGVPAAQALGAGEGDIEFPNVRYLVQASIDKGAPLDTVLPHPATGSEIYIALTSRTKAAHPNAARLFANYVMSPEGSALVTQDAGSFKVYGGAGIPDFYVSPKPDTPSRKAEIRKLLGLQ